MGQAKQPVNDGSGVKRSNRLNAGDGILTMMYIAVSMSIIGGDEGDLDAVDGPVLLMRHRILPFVFPVRHRGLVRGAAGLEAPREAMPALTDGRGCVGPDIDRTYHVLLRARIDAVAVLLLPCYFAASTARQRLLCQTCRIGPRGRGYARLCFAGEAPGPRAVVAGFVAIYMLFA